MGSIFHPNAYFNDIYEITPEYLKIRDIKCVILDIDNTLVPYSIKIPSDEVTEWLTSLSKNGIKAVILSNAKKIRADEFAKGISVELSGRLSLITVGKAKKPLVKGFREASQIAGIPLENMCVIGDQIFTDILGGNRSKVFSILVKPIDINESRFIRFKRLLEKPILSSYFNKNVLDKRLYTLGVIGCPINHSISPQLHNTISEVTGYNFYYDKFEVRPEDLGSKFAMLKQLGFKGFNATIPHKEEIIKYLDVVDHDAKKIGAVNTVVFKNDGKSYGYNTDIYGFTKSLTEDAGFDPAGKSVLILGAGGAARSAAFACVKAGVAKVDISNRTHSKAVELAKLFNGCAVDAGDKDFSNKFREYDLIINTTSAGMKYQKNSLPLGIDFSFRKSQVCYDMIYSPPKTLLLKKAENEGAKAINGASMLFWQGVESYNIWLEALGYKKLTSEQTTQVRELLSKRRIMK